MSAMRILRSVPKLLASALLAAVLLAVPGAALADGAVVAPDGTLYEVFPALYGDVVTLPPDSPDGEIPVLALRVTPSDGAPTLELVDGTVDANAESSVSVELEESTGTLFVAYTKARGLMADMHVAVRRDGAWSGHDILSNRGFYLSINPKVVVTRQQYVVFDEDGAPVTSEDVKATLEAL
ncbi:MAG: hypothetical protein KJ062_18975, partial [Thermoanaerobaculia bacterium]|nr:hypothetical protein [Thermoanaerobaculia bacterium]